MMRAAIAIVFAMSGCISADEPTPAPEVRTDVAGLAQLVNLPPKVVSARWTIDRLGIASRGVPGPTDYMLTAYLRLEPSVWMRMRPITDPAHSNGTVLLSEDVAQRLLIGVAMPPSVNGKRVVSGVAYPSDGCGKSPYRCENAIRWEDGLLVQLTTM